jgi:hypothetical protein
MVISDYQLCRYLGKDGCRDALHENETGGVLLRRLDRGWPGRTQQARRRLTEIDRLLALPVWSPAWPPVTINSVAAAVWVTEVVALTEHSSNWSKPTPNHS